MQEVYKEYVVREMVFFCLCSFYFSRSKS